MKTAERIAICAIAAALAAPVIAAGTSYNKNIEVTYGLNVTFNGQNVEWIDSNGKVVQPFIYEDTAYVPLKTLAPLLGASSQYQYENNTVDIHVQSAGNPYQKEFDSLINDYVGANTGGTGSFTSNGMPQQMQSEYERLLADYEKVQEEMKELYNIGASRLDNINDGTAVNQEEWQETYNSTMQRLQDRLDIITSQMQILAEAYSEKNTGKTDGAKPQTSAGMKNNVTYAFPLHLYSNDGKVYLGKCVTDRFDSDSIWYPLLGDYSSEYSQTSIWNKFCKYGSALISQDESAFNDRAQHPPIIVDNDGVFIGYLTTNSKLENAWTIAELRRFVENNKQ